MVYKLKRHELTDLERNVQDLIEEVLQLRALTGDWRDRARKLLDDASLMLEGVDNGLVTEIRDFLNS